MSLNVNQEDVFKSGPLATETTLAQVNSSTSSVADSVSSSNTYLGNISNKSKDLNKQYTYSVLAAGTQTVIEYIDPISLVSVKKLTIVYDATGNMVDNIYSYYPYTGTVI